MEGLTLGFASFTLALGLILLIVGLMLLTIPREGGWSGVRISKAILYTLVVVTLGGNSFLSIWQLHEQPESNDSLSASVQFDAGSAMYLATVSKEVVQYDFSSGGVVSWGDKSYVALKMHESPFEPRARGMIDDLVAELEETLGRDIVHVDYYGEEPGRPYLDGIIVTWGEPLEANEEAASTTVPVAAEVPPE